MKAQRVNIKWFRKNLKERGYKLKRTRGSHEYWENEHGRIVHFPVHGKDMNGCLGKRLIKELREEK